MSTWARPRNRVAALCAAVALLASASTAQAADRLVFTCGAFAAGDICTMDPDVPFVVQNVTQTETFWERSPTWSPDGTKFAFIADYTGDHDVWTLPVGSTSATNVSETTDRWEYERPVWSPDSSRVAFGGHYFSSAPPNLGYDVFVAPANGTAEPTPIGSSSSQEAGPAWAPDGLRLAFHRNSAGILIGKADGSDTPAALPGGGGIRPAWSPDGSRIAFVSPAPGGGDIVRVVKTNGTGEFIDLGSSAGSLDEIVWSPDGTRVGWIDGHASVIKVRPADGSAPAHLIPHAGELAAHNLSFSPDGTRVVFDDRTSTNPYNQLWIAKADGTQEAVAITNGTDYSSEEAFWKPAPLVNPPLPPPPTGDKKPATVDLALFRQSGPINPFQMKVSIACHVAGYPPSNHPACRAFGDGFTRYQAPPGRLSLKATRRVKVVTARRVIAAGKKGVLRFRLTRAGKKILRPGRTVRVRLTIGVRQTGNKTVKKTRILKLRAPRRR